MGHNIVGRSEEGYETLDEVGFLRRNAIAQVFEVNREIELVGSPNILQRILVELKKLWVLHRTKSQIQIRVENHP
jgi:hypothetical protein